MIPDFLRCLRHEDACSMIMLFSWLSDFIQLSEYSSPEKLSKLFASLGIETAEAEIFEDNDFMLDLEITANRPDLLSHFGLAREISVLTGKKLKKIEFENQIGEGGSFDIKIISERCSRYAGLVMHGVKVSESPEWMKKRLLRVGLRPISNVVDATNYVLMELNHPMHAFDLDLLGNHIIVRQAAAKEKIKLLDGREYSLVEDDLVIANSEKPVALAGVMGGEETGVNSNTTNILLEAAWFQPASIRRTARRHGISSDSAYRFERGADPLAPLYAIRRLADVIKKISGGEISEGIKLSEKEAYKATEINFRDESVKRFLGCAVPRAREILCSLGVNFDGDRAEAPSWRTDLTREIDLIEEVARISGYDSLPETLPHFSGRSLDFIAKRKTTESSEWGENAERFIDFRRRIAEVLESLGFDRCVTFSFENERFGEVRIVNPINSELNYMRGTLLPSLLRVVELREFRGIPDSGRVFELDKTFRLEDGEPTENYSASAIIAGIVEEKRYDGRPEEIAAVDHAIGAIKVLGSLLKISLEIKAGEADSKISFSKFHDALFVHSADICFEAHTVGRVGMLDRSAVSKKIKDSGASETFAYGFEIDLEALWNAVGRKLPIPKYSTLPRFPSAERDLAFWVSAAVPISEIFSAVSSAEPANLEKMKLFDIFQPKKEDRKSVGIRLIFRSSERTLTDSEINSAVDAVIASIEKRVNGELRSR